jgi:hypothetical protein
LVECSCEEWSEDNSGYLPDLLEEDDDDIIDDLPF